MKPFDGRAVYQAIAANHAIAAIMSKMTPLSYLVATVIAARLAFAFPAIAIEAPGASLRQSLVQTRGSTWRLFFIYLLIFAMPIAIFFVLYIAAIVYMVINHPELARSPERLTPTILYATPFLAIYAIMFAIMMATIAVNAAAAARAYEIRTGRAATGVADIFR